MSGKRIFSTMLLYIKKNKWVFLFYLFAIFFFLFTLAMDGIDIGSILYAVMVVAFVGFIVSGIRFAAFYKTVWCLRQEAVPEKYDTLEAEYVKRIKKLEKEILQINHSNEIRKREMEDFYTMWVHQIKTPIATINLILQDEDIDSAKMWNELDGELFRIEQYVEMVLSYLRMESDSTDYVIKKYPLEHLIKQVVKKYAKQFIRKKIRLQMSDLDREIITDEKWFSFAFEQLLSNALKYTNQGEISIYCNENGELVLEDTGIGIEESDLPRIFEWGFTGYNGRTNRKSTGIGLYLCKKVLKNIGADIRAESAIGKGTKMVIDIRQEDMEIE